MDISNEDIQQAEEDEWCHLDFCWNNDEQCLILKDNLTQEQLAQCEHTYETAMLLDGKDPERGIVIVSNSNHTDLLVSACEAAVPKMSIVAADKLIDAFSYPIQNSRLSRSDIMKLEMSAIASNFLPSSYCANYRNPLTGRINTNVDNSLSQEQQAIKIAKAEAKRLRKQNKQQGTRK